MNVKSLDWLPGYLVREDGQIVGPTGVIRKTKPNKGGYQTFNAHVLGKCKTIRVHVLVCEAWHGPAPVGTDLVRHLDGNRENNSASNLKWGTHVENAADRDQHGNTYRGDTHPARREEKCQRGHLWTEENTYWRTSGRRTCRQCRRDREGRRS